MAVCAHCTEERPQELVDLPSSLSRGQVGRFMCTNFAGLSLNHSAELHKTCGHCRRHAGQPRRGVHNIRAHARHTPVRAGPHNGARAGRTDSENKCAEVDGAFKAPPMQWGKYGGPPRRQRDDALRPIRAPHKRASTHYNTREPTRRVPLTIPHTGSLSFGLECATPRRSCAKVSSTNGLKKKLPHRPATQMAPISGAHSRVVAVWRLGCFMTVFRGTRLTPIACLQVRHFTAWGT